MEANKMYKGNEIQAPCLKVLRESIEEGNDDLQSLCSEAKGACQDAFEKGNVAFDYLKDQSNLKLLVNKKGLPLRMENSLQRILTEKKMTVEDVCLACQQKALELIAKENERQRGEKERKATALQELAKINKINFEESSPLPNPAFVNRDVPEGKLMDVAA